MNISFKSLTEAFLEEFQTVLYQIDPYQVEALKSHIRTANRIFVAGKGRSGLQMRAFAMRLMHLGLTVYVVDDVTTPAILSGDLLIMGSGSGKTASLINYAEKAFSQQAKLALITTNPQSPIAKQADCIVHIPAITPKHPTGLQPASSLPMASVFEQALGVMLDLLSVQLRADLHLTDDDMFTRHANLE